VEGRPLDVEERGLVDAAQGGDERAYEELVRMYSDIAYRTAYVFCGSADDAEDAAQDAFVKAWRALGRFRHGAPFKPWLLQIVANEARNRRRSAGRRARLTLRVASEASSGDAAPSPEVSVLAGEQRSALLNAVESLPDDARDVVVCRYLLDLSEEETATVLDVARGTVKSRSSRALERLRGSYD
jgi:RNA polymerase sigma factor (sigma-70 family)